ncbi:hypothetical protein KCU81_g204, partial [Aureobasidium melanogenum]
MVRIYGWLESTDGSNLGAAQICPSVLNITFDANSMARNLDQADLLPKPSFSTSASGVGRGLYKRDEETSRKISVHQQCRHHDLATTQRRASYHSRAKTNCMNKTYSSRWSPTVVLICRSTAYVWQSGRDAQFSADCGRMDTEFALSRRHCSPSSPHSPDNVADLVTATTAR